MDEDKNGKISFKDLKKIIFDIGINKVIIKKGENLSDDEILEMLEEADRDGDG